MILCTICDTVWCFRQFQLEILLSRLRPPLLSPQCYNTMEQYSNAANMVTMLQYHVTVGHISVKWYQQCYNTMSQSVIQGVMLVQSNWHRPNVTPPCYSGHCYSVQCKCVVPKMVISASSASTSLNRGFVLEGKVWCCFVSSGYPSSFICNLLGFPLFLMRQYKKVPLS